MKRLWLRLTCNWLVIGLRCAVRGHDWGEQGIGPSPLDCRAQGVPYAGFTHKLTVCRWCGQFRGWRRVEPRQTETGVPSET